MLEKQKVLITGGAGFIGTHLSGRLVSHNQVVILDSLHRNALKASGLAEHPQLKLCVGDVTERKAVEEAMEGCDYVIHLASIAGVDTVMQKPVATMRINLLGALNVLEVALTQKRVKRLIDFSTSEVFGRYAYNVTEGDVTSLGAVGEARWTYAVSKLATEHLAFTYYKQYGLPTCSIRPFNIYGPRQVGEGAVHHFIVCALKNELLKIHNDGGQIRAWCYIDDIVEGTLIALEHPQAIGQAFNIGNPRSTVTIYNLAREIVQLTGSKSVIEFVPWPYPDVELRIPNINKARDLLGFNPHVDLEEGLRKTISWYREQL